MWVQTDGDRRYDCPCKEVTRCIASIHQYPKDASASDVAKTMRMMSARGYDAIFLTERIMPSHYSQVPAIWPLVVDSACKTVINQGNMDDASQKKLGDAGTNTVAADFAAADFAAENAKADGARRLLRSA